ncbi:cytochrome P450 [Ruania zhangjianzhongii]|uniref:cytochrome P450 n=1 Tax=Ruania zhangjianzhongii TaxID=2603206 RepID=UPI001F204EF4|nr:cytochrome P450 [Ruania zhangjianzhongii]
MSLRRLPGLLTEGYAFISRTCDNVGTDAFRVHAFGRPVTFLRGADASRLFYGGQGRFTRAGAVPTFVQHLLQDEGSVQGLDSAAHRHRKAMFRALLTSSDAGRIVDLFAEDFARAARYWAEQDRIALHSQAELLLTRTALRWAGVPLAGTSVRHRARELSAMVDWIGLVGPGNWAARLLRRRTEAWAAGLVSAVRAGELSPPGRSALAVIAGFRDDHGDLLTEEVAAVELINVLRPIVAVSRFVTFAAVALMTHPHWRETFAQGTEADLQPFVHEVRRYYPFFPAVPGRTTEPFTWQGAEFAAGELVVLDLYGTNHHRSLWELPEAFAPERFRDWDGDPHTLIPQGGGDSVTDHRCPGEPMTIALMKEAVRLLTRSVTYTVPVQDLSVPLNRGPALPREGVLLAGVQPVG